jgi:hypothetical protein
LVIKGRFLGSYRETCVIFGIHIDHEFVGDTMFPWYDEGDWQEIAREDFGPDKENLYALSFRVYDRKTS